VTGPVQERRRPIIPSHHAVGFSRRFLDLAVFITIFLVNRSWEVGRFVSSRAFRAGSSLSGIRGSGVRRPERISSSRHRSCSSRCTKKFASTPLMICSRGRTISGLAITSCCRRSTIRPALARSSASEGRRVDGPACAE
jgi:hypothetical protein